MAEQETVLQEETLGERIHRGRRRLGLTLKELADRVGTDTSSLSRYERDVREPGAQLLAKIARELETSPDYLLGFRSTPSKLSRAA